MKKTWIALAGVAIAFAMLSVVAVPSAGAQTSLDAQIQALLQEIAALQAQISGGTSAPTSDFVFTRNLTVGSTGNDVMELQKFLNAQAGIQVAAAGSAGSPGMETSYFGPATKAALAQYQAANGISPAVGYFGPITRGHVNSAVVVTPPGGSGNLPEGCTSATGFSPITGADCSGGLVLPAGCTSTSGYSPTTGEKCDSTGGSTPSGDLEGGAGSLDDADYISKLSNEEVGEGESDVEVAGLEIEAGDGSDLEILAVNLNFSKGTADRDFHRYADEVSVLFDGEEVARLDADEFTRNNNYDKNITIGTGNIIRAGETKNLVVRVTGVTNLDSGDASETWTLEFESVRYRDAQGAIITDTSTGDINDGTGRTFSFEEFAAAVNAELIVTNGDDDINEARVIVVSDTADTDDVDLFSFNLRAKGNSDITIDDLPVLLTSVGADTGAMINTVELWADGTFLKSKSVASTTGAAVLTRTVVFDDMNFTINAGDTVEMVVRADFNDLEDAFGEGDTIKAEFGETQTDLSTFDVRDEQDNELSDARKTGSATSEAHVVYENAPVISNITTSVSVQSVSDSLVDVKGVYTIEFDVTAAGADLYIASSTASTTDDSKGIEWAVKGDTFAGAGTSNLSVVGKSLTASSAFKVNAGQTERFKLVVSLDNQAPSAGFFGVEVDSINFLDAEDTGFAATAAFLGTNANYTTLSVGLDDLETSNVSLN